LENRLKLSIFAVSALVLSTSFAAVGWADEHPTQGEADSPGAGGAEFGGLYRGEGNYVLGFQYSPGEVAADVTDLNLEGTPAGPAPEENEE
jgi:hypothetical protein